MSRSGTDQGIHEGAASDDASSSTGRGDGARDESPQPVDRVFADPISRPSDFKFDQRTATVFDDMVGRSVPFYDEIQRMSVELAADFATSDSNLYDIGCATGTTLLMLEPLVDPSVRFVGIDNSPQMLQRAQDKLDALPSRRERRLVCEDVHERLVIENASVVFMTLTLQFVRPLHRERVVKTISDGLRPQGAFILVEKLTEGDTLFNRLFIKYYYDMKRRRGYSDLEISQKREALENVLIPYRLEENEALLRKCGFSKVQVWFRWYNFCGIIAVK